MSAKPRLKHLDGMRAVAAVYVVIGHAYLTVFDEGHVHEAAGHFVSWMGYSHIAVVVFIVLSGYSLMLGPLAAGGHLPDGFRGFMSRRVRRILPAYYLTLLLSALLAATVLGPGPDNLWRLSTPFSVQDLVVHAALLQDLHHGSAVNYVLWSMAIEWHAYLLMPLLLILRRRFGMLPVAAAAVVVTSLCVRALMHHAQADIVVQAQLFGAFVVGMAACELGGKTQDGRRWMLVAGGLAACYLLANTLSSRLGSVFYSQSNDVLVMAATAAFLVASVHSPKARLVRLLSSVPFRGVGRVSYSLYLVHPLVLEVVWRYGLHRASLPVVWTLLILIAVAVPVSIGAASLQYRFAEAPYLRTSGGPGAERAVEASADREVVPD